MTMDRGAMPDGREDARPRSVSRAVPWSYVATAASVVLWITLVVVNRRTNGEVHPSGSQADLHTVVLPLWTALGVLAVLLALIGLVRSRAKGHAVVPLVLAVFVGAVPIVEQLLP